MTRYMVVIERGESSWGAHVPDLPGCVAVGESKEEVVGLIQAAIAMHIQELSKQGMPIPPPASEGTFVEIEAA
jgi:predicted RNase H-like HicB family nuclease